MVKKSYKFLLPLLLVIALVISWGLTNVYASIVLKVAAVNPSPEVEKEVELNIPLPKEVEPDDIISLGDLELDFDAQKNVYYVHKKIMLEPKDSVVREVEIEDVWLIDKAELARISQKSEKLWDICQSSQYAPQASFLKNSIESKINQIIKLQESTAVTPQEHISDYRKNLERLKEVKANLDSLTSVAGKVKPVSAKTIWRLILLVVGFLAVVAVVFIFIWRRYLKSPELEELKPPRDEGGENEGREKP